MSIDQNAPPPVPLDENDDGGTGSTTTDPDALAATELEPEAPPERDVWTYVDRAIDWLFDHWPALLVGVGAFWYFWYMSNLTIEVHRGYGTSAFDIGVFDQATWLLSRFHNPFVTITGRNLFGDHTSYILLFVAPLYWFRPNPTTLLYLQAGVVALATIPIYLVGKKRIGAPLAAFMALAYLLQPALAGNNMENYHPDHFMALFVALALYAAIEDRRWLFVVSCALCLLVKEDAILIVLPMAAWFAWRRHLRLGVIVAAATGLWTILAFKTIRSFNHGLDLQSGTRIPFGKPGKPGTIRDVIDTMYRKPGVFVDYMRSEQRPWFAWQLLAPVAFVFLFSPEITLVGVFVLAWNLLSLFGYQHQIGYHYDFVIIPAIVIGTIWAISRMKKPKHRQIAVAVVFLCSLWTAFLWGPFAWSRNGEPGHWTASNPVVLQIEQIRKQIPKDCGVMTAYHSFVPHVDHRERIYMWPVPWHAVYWGQIDKEGQKLPFTNDIQCLFLPTQLSPDDQKLFDTFKDQFEVVASNPGATIYKRVRPE